MFSTKKLQKSRLLAENQKDYIYFNKDGAENVFESETKLEIIPNSDAREILYICGASGTGKSTLAAQYIKKFIKIFPDSDIFIISRKDSDEVFDDIEEKKKEKDKQIKRIKIDDELLSNPIDILKDSEPNTLFVFDDIDSIEIRFFKLIYSMILDLLEVGRSYKLYGIITSHLLNSNNKKFSRVIFNEAHFIFFPPKVNKRGNRYFLKEYMGFNDDEIDRILEMKDRFVCVHKQYPPYIIGEHIIRSC